MPPKDFYGGGILCFDDGTPIMRVADIPEVTFDELTDETPENTISLAGPTTINLAEPVECTLSFTVPRRIKKRLWNLCVYGWRAKGPVRKKGLKKAIKLGGYIKCRNT